ncbi:MAG: hypothetical protein IK042_05785 [Bacteroidales bacterium]|nr:hypothetical protein [Bacteroidales bacterium]
MKKYLDIAKSEKVLIQRGKNETFVLVAESNSVEYDLSRSLTVDDVINKVSEGLKEIFEGRENLKGTKK